MLNKKFYNETYDKFLKTYGQESEMRLCIEEMSELTKELCKYIRYSKNSKSDENDKNLSLIKNNIIEETADVLICVEQIKRIFGEKQVTAMMDYKIQRGRKIVDEDIKNANGR